MTRAKILLIDDSEDIHVIVRKTLSDMADVISALTYQQGKKLYAEEHYQIIIIDLNLADMNGMELLKQFKAQPTDSRFFIMTGKDSVNDELLGHGYGVDEYIKKPVNRDVLKAIVQKNLKIIQHSTAVEINVAPFQIFPDQYKVFIVEGLQKAEVQLTIKEFKILAKLVAHPDKPFSREELFNQIWDNDSDSTFRTIDMHVSSLRKKLGDQGIHIKTVHQVGYKFSPK